MGHYPRVIVTLDKRVECGGILGKHEHPPVMLDVDLQRGSSCPVCDTRFVSAIGQDGTYAATSPGDVLGPPEFIEIEPIHTCNLRCVMCHVSYESLSKVRLDPAFTDKMVGFEGRWAVIGGEYEPVAHPG